MTNQNLPTPSETPKGTEQPGSLQAYKIAVCSQAVSTSEPVKVKTEHIAAVLSSLTIPMKASGRLKASDAEIAFMVSELAERLTGHHAQDVIHALEEHTKSNSFFPDYAQIMHFVQPRIDHRLRLADQKRRNVPWRPDMPPKKRQEFEQIGVAAGLMEEPAEVRKAAVATWWDKEREAIAEKAEKAEQERAGTKTSEKVAPIDKKQPWHDSEALKASARRLNQYEVEEGRRPLFSVTRIGKI